MSVRELLLMATNTPAADGYSPPNGGLDTGLFKFERSRSILSLGTTEANVVVPVAGLVVVAVRRPRVLRVVVPAAATQHPVVALRPMTEIILSRFVARIQRRLSSQLLHSPCRSIGMQRNAERRGISRLQLLCIDQPLIEFRFPPPPPAAIQFSPPL